MKVNDQPPISKQTHSRDADMKTLHVNVSAESWLNARKAALDSRMKFKDYVAELLLGAVPFPSGDPTKSPAKNVNNHPSNFTR